MSHLGGIDLTTLGPPANRAESKADAKYENPFHFNFHNPFKSKPVLDSTNSAADEVNHDQAVNLETAEVVPLPGHLSANNIVEEETDLQIPRGEISAEEAGNVAILAGVGNSVGIKEDLAVDVDAETEKALDSNSESEDEKSEENEENEESEELEEVEDIPA